MGNFFRRDKVLGPVVVLGLLIGLIQVATATPSAATSFSRSQDIALVPNASGRQNNGGTLPTTGFPGYNPSFSNITPESIRDDATDPIATGFDTVVLNGICDISAFLSNNQFKTRVEGFVSNGGKLIIWDSECSSTDYNLFALPFVTSNPGAAGAQGTLTDVEENTLSSSDPTSPSYVNVSAISTGTDAVGDANVFTTFDPNWYADLNATNVLGVNGPVQAYANLNSGLVIYSGLDKDYLGGSSFDPAATDGATHLARIWMLELLQPWSPDGLPHDNPVVGSKTWVAMGDSFSSGEGAQWFDSGTDVKDSNECRRSDAYASIANGMLANPYDADHFLFVACSGARLKHFLTDAQYPNSPSGIHGGKAQLEYLSELGTSVSVVTMTLGGNDMGFADTLSACAGKTGAPKYGNSGPGVTYDVPYLEEFNKSAKSNDWAALAARCNGYENKTLGSFAAAVESNIDAVGSRLEQVYSQAKHAAPNARIYVVGYPVFIPGENTATPSCNGLVGLNGQERTWLRTLILRANDRIRSAATSAGVTYVDVEQSVEDIGSSNGLNHLICAKTSYWNGITSPVHNSFHPKREAHVEMAKRLIACMANESSCDPPKPWMVCSGETANIYGTKGVDELRGLDTAHHDVIVTLGGDDTVNALNGRDTVCGGDGNDRLYGMGDDDILFGESGNDLLDGGSGTDWCDGGPGTDRHADCETRLNFP